MPLMPSRIVIKNEDDLRNAMTTFHGYCANISASDDHASVHLSMIQWWQVLDITFSWRLRRKQREYPQWMINAYLALWCGTAGIGSATIIEIILHGSCH